MVEEVIENPERIDVEISKDHPCLNEVNILGNTLLHGVHKQGGPSMNVMLILNQKITLGKLFLRLWDLSTLKVCADGAANRLYEFFKNDEGERARHLPDYIIGDLDSLDPKVSDYYSSLGVIVIKQTTQYSTDFTKCINLISLHFNCTKFSKAILKQNKLSGELNHGIEIERGIHTLYGDMISHMDTNLSELPKINLLTVNAIGGRFDQTIHSITQLYNIKKSDPYFQVTYITETDIIVLIPAGGSLIRYDSKLRDQCIGNCGLLPIGEGTKLIETIGLKWDVRNWDTSIKSGRVSSSNRLVGRDRCYINSQDDIVLNIEIFLDKLIEYI